MGPCEVAWAGSPWRREVISFGLGEGSVYQVALPGRSEMKGFQIIFLESLGCPKSLLSCGGSAVSKQEMLGVWLQLRALESACQLREF